MHIIGIPLSTIYLTSDSIYHWCGGLAGTIECCSIAVGTGRSTKHRSEVVNMRNKKQESLRFSQCFSPTIHCINIKCFSEYIFCSEDISPIFQMSISDHFLNNIELLSK